MCGLVLQSFNHCSVDISGRWELFGHRTVWRSRLKLILTLGVKPVVVMVGYGWGQGNALRRYWRHSCVWGFVCTTSVSVSVCRSFFLSLKPAHAASTLPLVSLYTQYLPSSQIFYMNLLSDSWLRSPPCVQLFLSNHPQDLHSSSCLSTVTGTKWPLSESRSCMFGSFSTVTVFNHYYRLNLVEILSALQCHVKLCYVFKAQIKELQQPDKILTITCQIQHN